MTRLLYIAAFISVWLGSTGLALAEPFLYVATNNSNFTVIDAATKKVVRTIPLAAPVFEEYTIQNQMAVTPDGKSLYFISGLTWADSTVSVLNTNTNKISKPISVKRIAHSLAISPDGEKVYVDHSYEHGGCGYDPYVNPACSRDFTTIDIHSGKVSAIPNVTSVGTEFVISPDGERAYGVDGGGAKPSVSRYCLRQPNSSTL
jgi:DNA-binding beta-propeller fold protein YncE